MSRTYLTGMVCLMALAIGLVFGQTFLQQSHAQTVMPRAPFTAKMRQVAHPGTPEEQVRGERIVAFKSDGTELFAQSMKDKPVSEKVVRITHPDGRVTVLVGPLGGKSSWFSDQRQILARADMRKKLRKNGCITGKQVVAGYDVFEGMSAIIVDTPPDPPRNNLVLHIRNWVIPELDCFSVKSVIHAKDASGRDLGVSLRETIEFQRGEPDESLFTGTAQAAERKPSELQRDYMDSIKAPPCAECDQQGQALDQFYDLHQTK